MTKRRGFSLLEMMLVVSISSVIMLSIYTLLRQSRMVFQRSEARNTALTQARSGLELMIHTLERGKAGTWRISSMDADHPASRLDFKIAEDQSPCAFYWSNGTIQMKTAERAPAPVISHIRFLTFTGSTMDPATLAISFRLETPIAGGVPYTLLVTNREVHLIE